MGKLFQTVKSVLYYGKVIRKMSDLVKLSHNTIRSKHVSLDAVFGQDIMIMGGSHVDCKSRVGSYTFIGYNCFVTRAEVGRYCSIANNVSIGMGEHTLDRVSTNSIFYDNAFAMLTQKDCILGNDVWIGVDSIIRRGVKIGHGAVIGANSFVTHDVPDFAVVTGSPARILKYRFSDVEIAAILESGWWDCDKEAALIRINELETRLQIKSQT
jgi:acetyltransferase-like isoleucine patch superfamily enzyme